MQDLKRKNFVLQAVDSISSLNGHVELLNNESMVTNYTECVGGIIRHWEFMCCR